MQSSAQTLDTKSSDAFGYNEKHRAENDWLYRTMVSPTPLDTTAKKDIARRVMRTARAPWLSFGRRSQQSLLRI
jgi:hypothetical protein